MRNLMKRGKTYCVVATDPSGKQRWQSIGAIADWKNRKKELTTRVNEVVAAIKQGEDRAKPKAFEHVLASFERHYVKERALRTARQIHANFERHVLPAWSGRDFTGIKRGDVADLLNKIVERKGPVAADKVLALLSKLMTWYAANHNDYTSPIVRGMRRSNPKDRARTRILSDDELRAVWKAAEANGVFGAFVRLSLLTAQRRDKLASMKRSDIENGVWTIPAEAREKGNAGELVLPDEARAILEAMPRYASSPYVFTTGNSYIKGYSKMKAALGKRSGTQSWCVHDLRRTAKSLMARAGVRPDLSERVLGHVISGVEGIYDRHEYRQEKADALRKLAGLIAMIVNPPADHVKKLYESTGSY
jgi:integrase